MANIYRLTKESYQIKELIELAEGEVTEEIEVALNELNQNSQSKALQIAGIISECEDAILVRKEYMKNLKEKNDRDQKTIDGLKNMMLKLLHVLGVQKIDTPLMTVSIRKNPHKVEIIDGGLVPEKYQRIKTETVIDKKEIRKIWRVTGLEVAGTKMIQTETIKIK